MDKVELVACPFCGETGDGSMNGNLHFVCDPDQRNPRVKCVGCMSEGAKSRSIPTAIEAWNTRTEPSTASLQARIAVLEGALGRCLNYIENTESELGITLESGDLARTALKEPAR